MRSEEYERVVRFFDSDGDGKISASELSHKLGQMGGKLVLNEAAVAVEALDSNGDGLLDLHDIIKLMEEDNGEEEKLRDLREAFEMYDEDGCGFITPKGLKRMLKKLGESKSIDECKLMIKQFDINGDGVLSFEEFRVMMM
ncbi:calmodulin-like 38 [Hibiscus trionum]|uniref:Calmodulin-like 38 n=1 Tax=Hibiscus trionum TaxID=183268 RepID=A0A9W7HDV4_HIBTR|nr:calmodulin-like 38 [Hibiscus trionum]